MDLPKTFDVSSLVHYDLRISDGFLVREHVTRMVIAKSEADKYAGEEASKLERWTRLAFQIDIHVSPAIWNMILGPPNDRTAFGHKSLNQNGTAGRLTTLAVYFGLEETSHKKLSALVEEAVERRSTDRKEGKFSGNQFDAMHFFRIECTKHLEEGSVRPLLFRLPLAAITGEIYGEKAECHSEKLPKYPSPSLPVEAVLETEAQDRYSSPLIEEFLPKKSYQQDLIFEEDAVIKSLSQAAGHRAGVAYALLGAKPEHGCIQELRSFQIAANANRRLLVTENIVASGKVRLHCTIGYSYLDPWNNGNDQTILSDAIVDLQDMEERVKAVVGVLRCTF
eukprot:TRINITY_DN12228_c1_g5_i7.p1 TRINITY_DN12228_c1_g5~~TRINITY_DN12228_c1_g5_i7.p1  ORF type:complete len:392 (+),score=25.43 TRINITY_DN12228_c1_g5_i7:166-1176(+)